MPRAWSDTTWRDLDFWTLPLAAYPKLTVAILLGGLIFIVYKMLFPAVIIDPAFPAYPPGEEPWRKNV